MTQSELGAALEQEQPDDTVPEAALLKALSGLGFESFRPGQREAIETLLDVGRLLLVAPTGGGKSLIYQLPARLLDGTTIVISPLIALMQDQVAGLTARGVRATYLASTLPRDELYARMNGLEAGKYEIAYVAPERLSFGGFGKLLSQLNCPLIAIDEAHCISEWGHDFRPEYMRIGRVLEAQPKARVLACTATATPIVRDEILSRLGLGPDTPQHVRGFARPNLTLRALEVDTVRQKRAAVDALLREALLSPGAERGTAIVYSPTRKQSEQESERLAAAGWRAAAYHAGFDGSTREEVQRRFIEGELEVIVATNAFGMGIDRSDVRAVAHLAPPGSVEAYYQEVGRAGRDGADAYGLLLAAPNDFALRRRLLELDVDGREPDPAVVEHKWSLFLELMRWVEGGSCRHDAILRYFGTNDEASGCGRCDVCVDLTESDDNDPAEVQLVIQKALSAVARVHGKLGLTAASKLLRGRTDDRLKRYGLTNTRTFGILKGEPQAFVDKLLRRCVTAGWVSFVGVDRPVLKLTREGHDVMTGRLPARIILPNRSERKAPGARPNRAAADIASTDVDLFEALRACRLDQARELGVPPYVVATDRTLRDMATLRPTTEADLLMVHGVGATKAERYGEAFLAVMRSHGDDR